jgi:hypothetical protein
MDTTVSVDIGGKSSVKWVHRVFGLPEYQTKTTLKFEVNGWVTRQHERGCRSANSIEVPEAVTA